MNDLEKAKEIFEKENCTLVLVKGESIIKSKEHGLSKLVELIDKDEDLTDYSVCDNACGRAASFLYVLLGVKEVYANTMAKLSIQILDRAEIKYSANAFVETLLDSENKTDKMELAVLRSGTPLKAFEDIKKELSV